MEERDWRIPIEPRSKSKVTSLPLRYADTPTRGLGNIRVYPGKPAKKPLCLRGLRASFSFSGQGTW
jgi:hypothetical protein